MRASLSGRGGGGGGGGSERSSCQCGWTSSSSLTRLADPTGCRANQETRMCTLRPGAQWQGEGGGLNNTQGAQAHHVSSEALGMNAAIAGAELQHVHGGFMDPEREEAQLCAFNWSHVKVLLALSRG